MKVINEKQINEMVDIIADIYQSNAEDIDDNKRQAELKRAVTIFAEDIQFNIIADIYQSNDDNKRKTEIKRAVTIFTEKIQRQLSSKIRDMFSDIINNF